MEIGKNFYQYQIQALLSENSAARHWLGKHLSLPRMVEIKQAKKELLQTESQKLQLRTIAAQNAILQHSHIQLLYDYLEVSQGIFFVFEHREGETLDDFLRKKPSEQARKGIFIQVLDAIAYSHRRGVLHLNLTPQNIWITQQEQVIVRNFGFSVFEPNHPLFTSPEQKQNAYTDTRSDIFALGKLLAYLFPNPSEHIQKVIQKACEPEAYLRYQTCEAMKSDLLSSFYTITHQQEEPKHTKPITYIVWLAVLALGGTGLWFVFRTFMTTNKPKLKELSFGNNTPMVTKDTIDYNKIALQKQQEDKKRMEKEKDNRTPEEKEKDSLDKLKKEKKEAREKRAKERKEQALKKVIVDGQFVSNNLGEYKINIEIFNSNKDIELQEAIILVSYYNASGDVIDKEEKIIPKLAPNEAIAVELVKKINPARFTCKIKDAKLPPDPNEVEEDE